MRYCMVLEQSLANSIKHDKSIHGCCSWNYFTTGVTRGPRDRSSPVKQKPTPTAHKCRAPSSHSAVRHFHH